MQESIHQIVRDAERNYVEGTTKLGKYIDWSMYDTIETIDAYTNSKHTSGATDSLGREKPFFNIVTAAVNIWYRATDLDRKNIKILPDKSTSTVAAFLATIHLQRWMDKSRFGVFLNQWGRTLAKYGSAVVKFVEKDGELIPSVIPWNRFIADPVDFDALPRIEKFYKTASQLRKMTEYDKAAVDNLIKANQTRKTLEGFNQDNEDHFIELYEIHGDLPEHFLEDDYEAPNEDRKIKYRQQMHVISFVLDKNGEYQDFTLYKGKEKRDPYMITHLIEEDGRTLAIGAVEYLFDAQWMQNHTMKQWKDQLDLASRLIFQTADANFLGRNVLTAIETGDIMVHEPNKPLSQVNNQGHDITNLQAFSSQWKVLGNELVGISEAMLGQAPKSGTAWRQTEALLNENYSLFNVMTQSKELAIEDMLRIHVIPHIKTKLDTKEEIVATLDDAGITQIDSMYVPREAIRRFNQEFVDAVLNERAVPSPFMEVGPMIENQVKQELAPLGNQRFFKPDELDQKSWKEILKDLEWNVRVEAGNENKDKTNTLTTLTTIFKTLAQVNPEKADMVLNKILTETSVVSPLELSTSPKTQPTASPPTVGGAGQALSELTQ